MGGRKRILGYLCEFTLFTLIGLSIILSNYTDLYRCLLDYKTYELLCIPTHPFLPVCNFFYHSGEKCGSELLVDFLKWDRVQTLNIYDFVWVIF